MQVEVEDRGVVIVVVVDPTILCLATLESVIDGPKMKNSTASSFLSRMKMMRNTLSSGNSTTPDVVGLLDPNVSFYRGCSLFGI